MSAEHDHPKAAPGELDHIRQLVNTFDVDTGEDELPDPQTLAAWLTERGLLAADASLTDADLQQARAAREALRKLLLANNGDPVDPAAVDTINSALKSAELVVRFDGQAEAALEPVRPGIDGAIGRLAAIAFRSMAEGTWPRMKACADHTCEWAFYDWSKNRSGAWCDMAVCGNRAKARAYRERRQRGASTTNASSR
jgi:predicted RNA-binding Zn ribbon-like protein